MTRAPDSIMVLPALCAAWLLCGCGQKPQAAASPYLPTATFQEIMDSVVDPAADYIWQAVSTTVDAGGQHNSRPQTDADWHALRQRAIVLVEAANLIAVPGRRVARGEKTIEEGEVLDVAGIQHRLDREHDALVGFAGALRAVGLRLVDAADRHSVADVSTDGSTLDEVCESCHKVFWYPPPVH
jgi:hypothetical protein